MFPARRPSRPSRDESSSSTSIYRRATSDRGHDQDAVSFAKLVVVAAQKADVFLVDVNVYEPPHCPGIIPQMPRNRRIALLNFAEKLGQRPRTAFDRLHAIGEPPQRRWNFNCYFHLILRRIAFCSFSVVK